ncbi:(d)CMP kinase [Eudoraea adriatica]|uniref:(d)CMP kinase n=1 Tax=Eudoraea adriatica TaxID=446681 RepID=UPI00037E8689|nr:(d)CMP kinase [Eudoraea adriatica]
MSKIIIAIDGYSSTGKSTIAKELAKALNYVYVDTGAMYRAITLFALEQNCIVDHEIDVKKLLGVLPMAKLRFQYNKDLGYSEMFLNEKNVEKEIRSMRVSKEVSKISVIPEVRKKLVSMQREMGDKEGVVMDGRDIGTVVFPNAELKIFMTASPDIRASRRYKELISRGENVAYEEVLKNVRERDYIDSHRASSPLVRAKDAIIFDNSDMGLKEQFERIYYYALKVIDKQKKNA